MARLFVAVRPTPEVLSAIAELPRPDEPGVRWVPPGQWHVTVRFLGEAAVDEAATALLDPSWTPPRGAVAALGPRVSKLGRAVVCVPVAGLDALAAAVASATGSIGDPPDPRPFHGHLTLARLRHRGACGLTGTPFSATFPVAEVELVRSVLGGGPARHEVVARRALA